MTGPVTTEALVEALAYLKPHETNGGTISLKAPKAREAVAVIEASLATATSELARLRADGEALRAALAKIGAMTECEWHGEDYVLPGEKPGWVTRPTPVAKIALEALARAATTRKGQADG